MKTVYITGCSDGIGRALASHFAESGWQVVAFSRRLVESDSWGTKGNCTLVCLDLSNKEKIKAVLKKVTVTLGVPSLVINNAATNGKPVPLINRSLEEIESIFRVNAIAPIAFAKHLIPVMESQGGGVIANVTSKWGRKGVANEMAYVGSKWALEGFTFSLAKELEVSESNVGAVLVDPGSINTKMLREAIGEKAHRFPTPNQWVVTALDKFQALSNLDNGKRVEF